MSALQKVIQVIYEQKYGKRMKNLKEIVLHQCVCYGDFMLLDYEAIRYHLNLRLRKKKHKTPFSEYFAQVFDNLKKSKVRT